MLKKYWQIRDVDFEIMLWIALLLVSTFAVMLIAVILFLIHSGFVARVLEGMEVLTYL